MGEKRAGLQRGGKIWDDKQLWTWWRTKKQPTTTNGDLRVFLQSSVQQGELLSCCQRDGVSLSWALYWRISSHGVQAAVVVLALFRWLAPPTWPVVLWLVPTTTHTKVPAGSPAVSRKSVSTCSWSGGAVDETKQKIWQTRSEEIREAGQLRYLVMWLQSDRLPGSGCVSVCCYASEDCGDRRHVLQGVKVREGEGKRARPGGGTPFVSF